MSINAFVDNNYPPGKEFCVKFLSSPEFKVETLRTLISSTKSQRKDEIAANIADALENKSISSEDVLLAYVKQPRTWLSIKTGSSGFLAQQPNSPTSLLSEFGKDGWYGPIKEPNEKKEWYVRTYKITDYFRGIGIASQLDERYIRWSVIAEVGENYIALSWDGFTFSSVSKEHIDRATQFPFWHHIPNFFDEIANFRTAEWEHPNLHKLVLHQMWDKYLNETSYKWRHLRIRAEASGLAINARSAGVREIDVKGLEALSQQLAKSVLATLDLADDPTKMNDVEDALLLTLIKKWGTKSYEFCLDRDLSLINLESEALQQKKCEYLFKAHCYFGMKPNSKTQDSLQHLKCHSGYYGGSTGVLSFLLKELGLRG